MATENDDDVSLEDTLPNTQDDDGFVIEGSEEAQAQETKPADDPLGGLSKEQISQQLKDLQSRLQSEQQLRETFTKMQAPQVVVQAPSVQSVPQNTETVEQKRQRINQKFLENPAEAMEELQKDALNPMLGIIIKNQEDFSKEILLKDANEKPFYDKYQQEVDAEVKAMQPAEKIQNPKVYQTALDRVKSRHQSEILSSMVDTEVRKTLEKLGIDPNKLNGQPAVTSLAGKPSTVNPNGSAKPKTVVPRWVAEQAERQGVSPGIMYELLKSKGQVK